MNHIDAMKNAGEALREAIGKAEALAKDPAPVQEPRACLVGLSEVAVLSLEAAHGIKDKP